MFLKKLNGIFLSFLGLIFSILLIRVISVFTSFPDNLFPYIQSFFSRILFGISNKIPFSLGDVFYSALGLFIILFLICIFFVTRKKNWNVLRKMTAGLIGFLVVFYWIFHLVWGFNYYKKPIKDDYNIQNISLDELKNLAEMYFNRSVELRKLVSEDEKGVFKIKLGNKELIQEIQNSAEIVKSKYPEIRFIDSTPPNLKKSLYSTPFSYMGVAGYYVPFTTEAQYNSNMPDTKLLFTQLHETAHQWGFAPENEANFVGFLLGKESGHADLNYASNYRAMRSILNRILLEDPVYVQIMLIRYSDGMKRDRKYEREINEKYAGKGDDAFSLMNEAFLRINNQEGLESYSRFVELLVGFNRKYSKSE